MPQNVMIDAINQNFRQIEGESRRKVVTDEDGKDRIIIGKKEDGEYAIKVSATGYDVNTADDDQLVMNSDWNMWKIIASGSTVNMTPSSTKRSSGFTLNGTNVGYVSDICIPIRNLTVPNASVFSYNSKPQVFLRNAITKRDMNFSQNFYNDGTNQSDINYTYFISGKYLVMRTIVRWVKGSLYMIPNIETYDDGSLYWEIANPTRNVPGGMGGGGSPTGGYIFYDSVTANPYTNDLPGYLPDAVTRSTVPANTYSSIYSYTYQFIDAATTYKFPSAVSRVPVIPAVDIDD